MNLFIHASTDLVTKFLLQVPKTKYRHYSIRDNCEDAVDDLITWAQKQGTKLTKVKGRFRIDKFVYDKDDFTQTMINQIKKDGSDFNKPEDRKQWLKDNGYAEKYTHVPHYWAVDKSGKIYDPSGKMQFLNTGLAKNLDSSRYEREER